MEDSGRSEAGESSQDVLNGLSVAFDARAALAAPRSAVTMPFPRALARDNIAACRRLVPPELIKAKAKRGESKRSGKGHLATASWTETVIRRSKNARANAGRRRATAAEREARVAALRAHRPPMADLIAGTHPPGPLDALVAAYEAGACVRVGIRALSAMRGTWVGTLVAFDKHLNLVLARATESYRLSADAPGTALRTRYLPQVFVRGASVVYVSLAPTEPRT